MKKLEPRIGKSLSGRSRPCSVIRHKDSKCQMEDRNLQTGKEEHSGLHD